LSETDAEAAKKVAERCRNEIFKEQIFHEKSQVSQLLTVSPVIGTIIPTRSDEPYIHCQNIVANVSKSSLIYINSHS